MTQQILNIIDQDTDRQITALHLETLLASLDRLHDAAHAGTLPTATTVDQAELLGWLEDIIFTAQETINEISDNDAATGDEAAAEAQANLAGLSFIKLYRR